MPNKCSVVGCCVGYSHVPRKPLFHFPKKVSQQERWIEFINRKNCSPTYNSTICLDHFEESI